MQSAPTGSVTLQVVDHDGDELPGTWTFEWSGADPLEFVVAAVTEVSGRPWKWSSRRAGRASLSADRCRVYKVRVGRLFNREQRPRTADTIARIVAAEEYRPGAVMTPARDVVRRLVGKEEVDWEGGLAHSVPALLRAMRAALSAAVESDGGLRISWS